MIAEINAGFTAAKHAFNVVKGISDLKTQTEINSAIFEVQQNLLDIQRQLSDAQQRYDEVAEQKRTLEAKLTAQQNWDVEAARYKLQEIASGIFVYVLGEAGNEPNHWLCPNCFQSRKKSILQKKDVARRNHTCPSCNFEITPTALDYTKMAQALHRPHTGLTY